MSDYLKVISQTNESNVQWSDEIPDDLKQRIWMHICSIKRMTRNTLLFLVDDRLWRVTIGNPSSVNVSRAGSKYKGRYY